VAGVKPEQVREKLRWDTPYLAKHCLRIIDKRRKSILLDPIEPQLRLDRALERQRAAGMPMRAIVLKSRKLGFSTWVQAKLIQRATQHENQACLVVAHDGKTAGELFGIGRNMYVKLPSEIKPPMSGFSDSARSTKYMRFGNRSRQGMEQGDLGLNSEYTVDTAQEVEAGRGFTFSIVHLSEVAFWPDEAKLTALLNAVPFEPETLVVIESTANGDNFFKRRWQEAVDGAESPDGSYYTPVFAAWHEDPRSFLPFRDEEHEEEFRDRVFGKGEWGEDEPAYIEQFGVTMEQLHWRRMMIRDQCESKLAKWKQEYPASPEEAFMASSKHVFSTMLLAKVKARTERTDPLVPTDDEPGPERGLLAGSTWVKKPTVQGTVNIPRRALWTPKEATGFPERHPWWRVWQQPVVEREELKKPLDQRRKATAHVISVDASEGYETDQGDTDFMAMQVVNHRTLEQCAEWKDRRDPDLVALEALLAALYFNNAWIMVETSGGYGSPIARALVKKYRYPRVYMRRRLEGKTEHKAEDRLGWNTDVRTKKQLIALGHELFRGAAPEDDETDGIRSRALANELLKFVYHRTASGNLRAGAEASAHDDLVMAWLIAQMGAQILPLPMSATSGPVDTSTRPVGSRTSGY
jgi:hypothetical protein